MLQIKYKFTYKIFFPVIDRILEKFHKCTIIFTIHKSYLSIIIQIIIAAFIVSFFINNRIPCYCGLFIFIFCTVKIIFSQLYINCTKVVRVCASFHTFASCIVYIIHCIFSYYLKPMYVYYILLQFFKCRGKRININGNVK